MAKKTRGKSAAMVSPLYAGGSTNGPVAGPTGGIAPTDPVGWMSTKTHSTSGGPSGSLSDRGANSSGERATAR